MPFPGLGKLSFLPLRSWGSEEEQEQGAAHGAAAGPGGAERAAAKQAPAADQAAGAASKDVPLSREMLEQKLPVHS